MKKHWICILYYIKRLTQKLICKEYEFYIPFRKSSRVFVASQPGTVYKFAANIDGHDDLKILIKNLSPGDTYFDIGANFGLYSLSIHDHFNGSINITCFEPELEAFRRLLMTRRINNAQWTCCNIGLGQKQEWNRMTTNLGGFNHVVTDTSEIKGNTQSIFITTLDQYCEENQISQIDMIKIDVEGFELFVFKGAEKTLRQGKIKKILFEVDGHQDKYAINNSNVSIFLNDCGFKAEEAVIGNFQVWSYSP